MSLCRNVCKWGTMSHNMRFLTMQNCMRLGPKKWANYHSPVLYKSSFISQKDVPSPPLAIPTLSPPSPYLKQEVAWRLKLMTLLGMQPQEWTVWWRRVFNRTRTCFRSRKQLCCVTKRIKHSRQVVSCRGKKHKCEKDASNLWFYCCLSKINRV